jgi:hypothetical protein
MVENDKTHFRQDRAMMISRNIISVIFVLLSCGCDYSFGNSEQKRNNLFSGDPIVTSFANSPDKMISSAQDSLDASVCQESYNFVFGIDEMANAPYQVVNASCSCLESLKTNYLESFRSILNDIDGASCKGTKLGIPYEILYVYKKDESVILETQKTWLFPLVINNEWKTYLKIKENNNKLICAGIGSYGGALWAERAENLLDITGAVYKRYFIVNYNAPIEYTAYVAIDKDIKAGLFYSTREEASKINSMTFDDMAKELITYL